MIGMTDERDVAAAHEPGTAGLDPVIVGLGKTGLSCARFLAGQGISFQVVDSRPRPPGLQAFRSEFPDMSLTLGEFQPELFLRAGRLIVSPGVSLEEPAIRQALQTGVPVSGDIDLFVRDARAPIVAVTGSNGKSTVTVLLGEMVRDQDGKACVGGNLGTPVLDLLHTGKPDLYVLELSSFQLETTHALNASAAVVLNVSPDHMDRYHSLQEYADAKRRVFQGAGVMVLNRDDPRVMAMAAPGRKTLGFTLGAPTGDDFGLLVRDGATWLARGERRLMEEKELGIKGRYNTANALAALAVGDAAGLAVAPMLDTLRRFRGLAHRCQWVADHAGVDWYNDSKGTNVGASLAAIQGLQCAGKLVLIAGGDGKGADFSPLRQAIRQRARAVVLIGLDGPRIARAVGGEVPTVFAETMGDAVRKARGLARHGDAVLLSPACASFDMFADYQARGNAFVAAVREEVSP